MKYTERAKNRQHPRARAGLLAFLLLLASTGAAPASAQLPERLSDNEFWTLVNDISEPGGYFRSDNFLSNERMYQWVIPDLLQMTPRNSVYLGVGPEQNFTYIAALQPRLAIIFDIRRQNMIEHLFYKMLFEATSDRADFLSRLFCRPRPSGLMAETKIGAMMQAYAAAQRDSTLEARVRYDVRARLQQHGFTLTIEDLASLDYVYNAFCDRGVELDYSFGRSFGSGFGRWMPTYQELMIATDQSGSERSFLASEATFRYLKDLHARNVIIPVVGDFAGPKAIRKVAEYLRAHNALVSVFYVSNVEQYLFQDPENWKRFYENVATLPLDESSMFVRSLGGPYRAYGHRQSVISFMQEVVQAYQAGRVQAYGDVIRLSR